MGTEQRYAANQVALSRTARDIMPYCCYPGCWKIATCLHHAIYRDRKGLVKGRELQLLGRATFTLCDDHHTDRSNPECAHHKLNWFGGYRGSARFDARQRLDYYELLCKGYDEKVQFLKERQAIDVSG